eukprot:Opistho-2@51423
MADEDFKDIEETPGYKAPKQVDLDTLKNLDANDESLNKWKQQLLKGAEGVDNSDPRRVIVEKLSLVAEGRVDVDLDLTGDLKKLKSTPFIIKEGSEYRIKVTFRVTKDVVAGLKYIHAVKRGPVTVDKASMMVGSYGPSPTSVTYLSQPEEAPSGMLARGKYDVKSKFIDDDKNNHLDWEWSFEIKKDWQ